MQDDMKRAVDELTENHDPSLFVASNGLRLRLKRVSQLVMLEAARRLNKPKIPRAYNEEKGRDEENPLDPEYVEAEQRYKFDLGMLAVSTYFILGTRIEGDLPDGVEPLASPDWVDLVTAVDPTIDIPETGPRRYLAWLKYHALSDPDQNQLLMACIRYSGGVLEADVALANANFPNNAPRNTDQRVVDPS